MGALGGGGGGGGGKGMEWGALGGAGVIIMCVPLCKNTEQLLCVLANSRVQPA